MIKKLLIALLSLGAFNCFSQVVPNLDWVKDYSFKNNIRNSASAVDANSNAYVTGQAYNGTDDDLVVLKYDSLGVLQYSYLYDNGGADDGNSIKIDASGNAYVTGVSAGTNGKDYITIMLDPAGNVVWSQRFDNPGGNGHDTGIDLVVDNSIGAVFVTGESYSGNGNNDITTVCYKLSNGVQQWYYDYNGAGNSNDYPTSMALSSNGTGVFITGSETGTSFDLVTINIDANGSLIWNTVIDGTNSADDVGNAIVLSGANVVVCGAVDNNTTNNDYTTIKYDCSNGSIIWQQDYDISNYWNQATGLAKDSLSNIAVVGLVLNSSGIYEYRTLLYDSTGTQLWVNTENTGMNVLSIYPKIGMDTIADHFYISGQVQNANRDILVYQVDPTGVTRWKESVNGTDNSDDAGVGISVRTYGIIYVVANCGKTGGGYYISTVKISQTPVYFPLDFNNEPPAGGFLFNENLGQVADMSGQPVSAVKYYTNSGQELYFNNNKLSYAFSKIDTSASTPDTTVRIELEFVKSNNLTKLHSFEDKHGTLNYYLGHCANGITGVRGFQRLLIPNIYPSIDLHYYSNQNGLKYYFVVKPGGNPNDILMRYNGAASSTLTTAGELYVKNTIGQIYQDQPTAYQIDWNLNVVPITSWQANYVNAGTNTYSLGLGTYTTALPLIIQIDQGNTSVTAAAANPEWSTFFGGNGDDRANEIATDAVGNLYGTGSTKSTNFPVLGVSTGSYSGGQDAFTVKFDGNYERKWATYFGGSNLEEGYGITFDNTNNKVYVCGATSSTNIPLQALSSNTASSYVESTTAPDKGFIMRIDELNGTREWLTKFGFADAANGTKIKADANGNIYVVGNIGFTGVQNSCATPTNNSYPICNPGSGAYSQTIQASATFGTGSTNSLFLDGYIARFNSSTALTWSTLFGGQGEDNILDLAIDNTNQKLYVIGSTRSTNLTGVTCAAATDGRFPLCNPTGSYFQQAVNGNNSGSNADGFISRFTLGGVLDWSTFFGGNMADAITDVAIDNTGKVVITGFTQTNFYGPNCQPSGLGFPLCSGGFTQAAGGGVDVFVAKFSTTAGLLWSTFYGGTGWDGDENWGQPKIATNLLNNEFYISGSTKSCASWPLTSNANFYQQNTHQDAALCSSVSATEGFIAGFDASNQKVYSSYFGGKGIKAGTTPAITDQVSCIATFQNKVYICGHSYSTSQYPFACPATTTNPYCDNTFTSVNANNSTALFAQIFNNVVGIQEQQNNKKQFEQFKIYPNPSDGLINLEWVNTSSKKAEILVYNSVGQLVYKVLVNETTGLNTQRINVGNLSHGVYIAIIKTEGQMLNAKFIKE